MAYVKGLPATGEEDGPRLLEEMCELIHHVIDGIAYVAAGVEGDMGALRLVEWVRDSSEIADFSSAGLGVEAFDITLFANCEGSGNMDHQGIIGKNI
jgi:hypothetical protein